MNIDKHSPDFQKPTVFELAQIAAALFPPSSLQSSRDVIWRVDCALNLWDEAQKRLAQWSLARETEIIFNAVINEEPSAESLDKEFWNSRPKAWTEATKKFCQTLAFRTFLDEPLRRDQLLTKLFAAKGETHSTRETKFRELLDFAGQNGLDSKVSFEALRPSTPPIRRKVQLDGPSGPRLPFLDLKKTEDRDFLLEMKSLPRNICRWLVEVKLEKLSTAKRRSRHKVE